MGKGEEKTGKISEDDRKFPWDSNTNMGVSIPNIKDVSGWSSLGIFAGDGLAGLFPRVYDWEIDLGYMFEWFIEQFQDFTIQIGEKS